MFVCVSVCLCVYLSALVWRNYEADFTETFQKRFSLSKYMSNWQLSCGSSLQLPSAHWQTYFNSILKNTSLRFPPQMYEQFEPRLIRVKVKIQPVKSGSCVCLFLF